MNASNIDEPIEIADYNPMWSEVFAVEAGKLRTRLGDIAVSIEHIGSSAVPGLRGKPILDVMVGVEPMHLREDLLCPLLDDYTPLGEAGVAGRLYFRKRTPNAFNVHVVEYQGQHWDDNLLVREYLRTHADVVGQYGRVKDEIVGRGITTLLEYSEAKHAIVVELLEQAQAWRAGTRTRE